MSSEQLNKIVEGIAPLAATYAIRIVGVLVLLWIAFRIGRWAGNKVTSNLEARDFDTALARFFGSLARWGINLGAMLSCLGVFGVETTSFAAVKKRDHQVFLAGLGDSSINFQVRIWCKTADYWTVWDDGVQAIKESLEEAGVGIPFPNLEVHFMNAPGPVKAA